MDRPRERAANTCSRWIFRWPAHSAHFVSSRGLVSRMNDATRPVFRARSGRNRADKTKIFIKQKNLQPNQSKIIISIFFCPASYQQKRDPSQWLQDNNHQDNSCCSFEQSNKKKIKPLRVGRFFRNIINGDLRNCCSLKHRRILSAVIFLLFGGI